MSKVSINQDLVSPTLETPVINTTATENPIPGTDLTATGTAGNEITIDSSNTSTHALVKAGGGTISCDYLIIQHSVASPSSTWYAGTNSTDNQAVSTAGSGWIFTAPPSTSNIASVSGVPIANIASVNGVPIANIASISTVSN